VIIDDAKDLYITNITEVCNIINKQYYVSFYSLEEVQQLVQSSITIPDYLPECLLLFVLQVTGIIPELHIPLLPSMQQIHPF
jgi:hypothetical protein